MIHKSRLSKLLFFDIETCGQYADFKSFTEQNPEGAEIWKKKASRLKYDIEYPFSYGYEEKVALYPEFGKIVCLSYGSIVNGQHVIKSISLVDHTTEEALQYIQALFARAGAQGYTPTGWNIKNFDIPWIQRKLITSGLRIPGCIATYGKKPWEVDILDLKEMWKSFSSLDVTFEEALYSMGIPTPKDDIDGSQVHGVYWYTKDVNRIQTYCEKDVLGMMHLVEKLANIES